MQMLANMTPQQRQQLEQELAAGRQNDGVLGGILNGLTATGAGVLGMASKGMEAISDRFDAGTFNAEAEKLSLLDRGAFLAGAAGAALQSGNAEAIAQVAAYQEKYRQDLIGEGEVMGLTPVQAEVYAASFFGGGDMDTAYEKLRGVYANRDENGNPIMGDDGRFVLSEANEKHVEALKNHIAHASFAGDQAGAMLGPVVGYNVAAGYNHHNQ